MAGKTSKTSVKTTAAQKTASTAAKASAGSKTVVKESTASKTASEKKATAKKTVKAVPAKTKPVLTKSASKPKTASQTKSKAVSAPKTAAKPVLKSEKTTAGSQPTKMQKKTSLKGDAAPKAVVKKTAKSETNSKTEKSTVVKKTTKTAKPAPAETAVKTPKKTNSVKPMPTKKSADSDTVIKKAPAVSIKKQEEPVAEPDLSSKPKAKRATKFMTKANASIIAQLKEQLLQRRNEIISSFWGDLGSVNVSSQASGDTADAAMDSVHSEMRSQLAEKESQELTAIDNALHKMETGEYGLCEECGCPIAIERLEVKPEAELCLKCQEELEEDGEYDNYSYYRYD